MSKYNWDEKAYYLSRRKSGPLLTKDLHVYYGKTIKGVDVPEK